MLTNFNLAHLKGDIDTGICVMTHINGHITRDNICYRLFDYIVRQDRLAALHDATNYIIPPPDEAWVIGNFFHLVPENYPGDLELDIQILTDLFTILMAKFGDTVTLTNGMPLDYIEEVIDCTNGLVICMISPYRVDDVKRYYGM